MDPESHNNFQDRRFDTKLLLQQAREEHIGQLVKQAAIGTKSAAEIAREINFITQETMQRDPMSGLYNKSGLEVKMTEAIMASLSHKVPLSISFVDGNKFKRINDVLGHQIGDKVILATARALVESLRPEDVVAASAARPGGDEFVVVLLGANLEDAKKVLTRVEMAISGEVSRFVPEHDKEFGEQFSVTSGVVQFDPTIDSNWEKLLDRADKLMLEIKTKSKVAR